MAPHKGIFPFPRDGDDTEPDSNGVVSVENSGRSYVDLGAVTIENAFSFDPKTPRSSRTAVVINDGLFVKSKPRLMESANYEFFMLQAWHRLLMGYSALTGVDIQVPSPRMVFCSAPGKGPHDNLMVRETSIIMSFILGDNVTKLGQYRRSKEFVTYSAGHPGASYTSLFPAAAFHLGVLCEIKEREGLVHGDFQPRHLILDRKTPRLYTVDLDSSRPGSPDEVCQEHAKMMDLFKKLLWKDYDQSQIDRAYEAGRRCVPPSNQVLGEILDATSSKAGVTFDHAKGKMKNSYSIPR